ncbi:MAG: sn-glycerol-3-phosphate ABC transporter substrate-binding protein UgpB [Magnetococcales bacterium]|nr:sn-glycerol-3-phosphate ABC transporter substrate-binding protein UgpB [Magnetococcales bacterium]
MASLGWATPGYSAVEIQWWHAMSGRLGEKVKALAADFNGSQTQFKVVPTYKGSYSETVTAGIAAFRAKRHPHILQVYEVGTATMMAGGGAVKPVHELMTQSGEPFDPEVFIPAVAGFYTTPKGEMLSLPFNSSTPVLYYNKEAFQKAGLNPDMPPATWPEVERYSEKLLQAGYTCGFSTAWISWIHLENLGAWHNVPIGTRGNGFEGFDARLTLDNPLHVKHLQQLADWQKRGIFVYGGRRNLGNAKFSSGECPMYTESSAGYAGFKANARFEFGVGQLPYWPDIKGAPQNTIIGGASLWVLSGHAKVPYQGVAQFFSYLSSPDVQADWHQTTGYLPITRAAYEKSKADGFYEILPAAEIPIKQLTLNPPTRYSKGVRFHSMIQIRGVIYSALESVLSGKQKAKSALQGAMNRANRLLSRFQKNRR